MFADGSVRWIDALLSCRLCGGAVMHSVPLMRSQSCRNGSGCWQR
jgi:hypothetical protein